MGKAQLTFLLLPCIFLVVSLAFDPDTEASAAFLFLHLSLLFFATIEHFSNHRPREEKWQWPQ